MLNPELARTAQQALIAIQRGDIVQARNCLLAARMFSSVSDDTSRFLVGMLQYTVGDYSDAVKTLRPIKQKEPIVVAALMGAGAALNDKPLFYDSLEALRRAGCADVAEQCLRAVNFGDAWDKAVAQALLYSSLFERPKTSAPEWDGGHVNRLCVLFRAGHGDSWLGGRYLSGIRNKVGKVTALVRQSELKVFEQNVPEVTFTTETTIPADADAWCCVMRLPFIAGERFGTAAWIKPTAEKLRFHVGVQWQGDMKNTNDRFRSIPIQALMPLFDTPAAITWHSLQVGPAAAQCPANLIDHSKRIHDWSDTVRIVSGLDLVIGPDSSVCNLAGAMGKPVWVLTENPPEWRWQAPEWYPSAKVFRQERRGDWAPVVRRVREELKSS